VGLRTRGACAVEPHRDLRDLGIHAVEYTTCDAVAFVATTFLFLFPSAMAHDIHGYVENNGTVNCGIGYFGSILVTHAEQHVCSKRISSLYERSKNKAIFAVVRGTTSLHSITLLNLNQLRVAEYIRPRMLPNILLEYTKIAMYPFNPQNPTSLTQTSNPPISQSIIAITSTHILLGGPLAARF